MEGLAIGIIILLVVTIVVISTMFYHQSNHMLKLQEKAAEAENKRQEISNFLTRFSAGIKGEEGFSGAMNAAAIHIGEQTDSESVAIYLMEDSKLRGVSVYGSYPLVRTANKLVFTRRRHLLETLRQELIAPGDGFLGGIVISRLAEQVPCGAKDERFKSYPEFRNLKGIMAVPMLRDGALVGVICAVGNRLRPSQPFSENQFERLQLLTSQVLMVHNLVMAYGEISRRDRIDQELELARKLQQSLLPKSNPNWGKFAIHAYSRSAKEVNGDFYDFIRIDDDRMLVVIADACGKGIPACMLTAMTRSVGRSLIDNFTTLHDFLCKLSDKLNRDTDADRFITVGCCLLNKKDMLLEFARAGHTDLVTFVHNHIRIMSPRGTAVGVLPARLFKADTICIALEPGTTVMMYSDGFTEATNAEGKEFGQERLVSTFEQACTECNTLEEIVGKISKQIIDYEESQADDQTLVLIRRDD
jgi:sigma-B regulation protein RsbU (phosphoserine phosphatase)